MGKADKGQAKAQSALLLIDRGNLNEVKKAFKKVPFSIVNESGQTPLHIACSRGHFEIVRWLLDDKKKVADVDARDKDGWTPLQCACHNDQIEIVDHLISVGANVNVAANNSSTAFDYFVRMQSQENRPALFERLFRNMIHKGVDVNEQHQKGETALHMAAYRGKKHSVSLLLHNNADPNRKDKYGETPLHLAARICSMDIVKALLKEKADATISGSRGTPLDVARAESRRGADVAALLEKAMGINAAPAQLTQTMQLPSGLPKQEPELPRYATFNKNQIAQHTSNAPAIIAPVVQSEIPSRENRPFLLQTPSPTPATVPVPVVTTPTSTPSYLKKKTETVVPPVVQAPPPVNRALKEVGKNTDVPPRKVPKGGSTRKRTKRAAPVESAAPTAVAETKKIETPSFIEHYNLGDCIGSGAFGSVYNGLDTHTGAIVAIKRVSLSGIPPEELENILSELTLLQRLEYKYIVQYVGFIRNDEFLNIVLEFVEGGSLCSIMKKFGGKIMEPLCARYVAQTLLGLDYLHRRGVVHRDIKGGNILVTKKGIVKLADFGIASVSDAQKNTEDQLATLHNVDKNQAADTNAVGSPYWMAPEVILMQGASSNSDIWSLGCTIIELVTGDPPYIELPPFSALFAMVKDDHPPLPPNLSQELNEFLLECFKKEPSERPTARALLTHPWLLKHVGDMSSDLSGSKVNPDEGERSLDIAHAPSSPTPVVSAPEPVAPAVVPVVEKPYLVSSPVIPVAKKSPVVKRAAMPKKAPILKSTTPVQFPTAAATPAYILPQEQIPVYAQQQQPQGIQDPAQMQQTFGFSAFQGIAPVALDNSLTQEERTAQILKNLEMTSQGMGMNVNEMGAIPTLSNVMENLMELQTAFQSAGIVTPQQQQAPASKALPFKLPQGRAILAQPERQEDSEEEESESEDEISLAERKFQRELQSIREYMTWADQAMKAEKGTRAASLRKALRKALRKLHAEYRDRVEAREMDQTGRNKIREIEENFPDNIGLDSDDTDYDSEDSYFLESDGDEDDFYF